MTSCPCSACTVLPETGASSTETPLLRASSCTWREVRGFTVLISITTDPARAPARAPSGPNITCSSAASFATLENTMSTPAASCFGVTATLAPRCSKGRAGSGLRLYTTTSWWAASNRLAMRLPIAPSPIKPTRIVSPQPLWILVCPIEMMGRFVQLVLPVARGARRPAEQHGAAHEDERIAHRLHPQHADVLLDQHGHDLFLEAVVMGIHHVQRHLHRVEPEPLRPRGVEHPEMDSGTLVTGASDVADFAGALRRRHRFQRAVPCEHALRIRHPDHQVTVGMRTAFARRMPAAVHGDHARQVAARPIVEPRDGDVLRGGAGKVGCGRLSRSAREPTGE